MLRETHFWRKISQSFQALGVLPHASLGHRVSLLLRPQGNNGAQCLLEHGERASCVRRPQVLDQMQVTVLTPHLLNLNLGQGGVCGSASSASPFPSDSDGDQV